MKHTICEYWYEFAPLLTWSVDAVDWGGVFYMYVYMLSISVDEDYNYYCLGHVSSYLQICYVVNILGI